MRVKLQLVMCNDEGHEETVTDVITLNKNNQLNLSRLNHRLPGYEAYAEVVQGTAPKPARSIYQTLSRVKSSGDAAYLLAVIGLIACKDARLFDASSRPWTPPSTFYKLL
jgi:hypothetical protein